MSKNIKEILVEKVRKEYLRLRLPRETKQEQEKRKSPETTVLPDLESLVAGQVDRFVQLGFHKELRESEGEYRAEFALPSEAVPPVEYAGRFDVFLVVEPRVLLKRQHELAKYLKELNLDAVALKWTTSQIEEYTNIERIRDLTRHPEGKPYLVFTHDAQKYRPYSVEKALTLFRDDEVGLPQVEVTALFLQHPNFFDGRGVDAAGSRDELGRVPCLGVFVGGPQVSGGWTNGPGQFSGVGSRGKEIIKLGV